MPIPRAAHPVTCALCHVTVNPIMARYLFLAFGWRGRPCPRPLRTRALTFCGPCGDLLVERMLPLLPRQLEAVKT